jgi:hypothetical protein
LILRLCASRKAALGVALPVGALSGLAGLRD